MRVRVTALIIALTIICSQNIVGAKMILSKNETNKYIDTIAKRQMREVKNPIHGSVGGEWTVMGLARARKITNSYKEKYKKNLKTYLDKHKGILSPRAYTEYSRTVIALTSIGENPFDFKGYDIISPLAEFDNVIRQGINGAAYALIAINSGGYNEIKPKNDYEGRVANAKNYKEVLVSSALKNGGWSIFGNKADVDMTAIAIQALSPYYNSDSSAKEAIKKGLRVLSEKQKNSGGFESMGNENCESSAQVLVALTSVGVNIEDKRFVKKNKTVLDGLMSYYKDGGFAHVKGNLANQMSTDQAFYALVSYSNLQAKEDPLFNMKKVANKKARKIAKKHKHNNANNNNGNIKANGHNNKNKKQEDKQKEITYSNKATGSKTIEKKDNQKEDKKKHIIQSNQKESSTNYKEKKIEKKTKKKEEKNNSWLIYVIVGIVIVVGATIIIYRIRSKNVSK